MMFLGQNPDTRGVGQSKRNGKLLLTAAAADTAATEKTGCFWLLLLLLLHPVAERTKWKTKKKPKKLEWVFFRLSFSYTCETGLLCGRKTNRVDNMFLLQLSDRPYLKFFASKFASRRSWTTWKLAELLILRPQIVKGPVGPQEMRAKRRT